MPFAKLLQAIRRPALKAESIVEIEEPVPYGNQKDNLVHKAGDRVVVALNCPQYVQVRDPITQAISYLDKAKSTFKSVLKKEADKLRDSIRHKLNDSPIRNGCGYQTGTDPEIFVLDGDGACLPAFVFLPDKTKPLSTKGRTGFSHRAVKYFYDGFQAEYTVIQETCHAYMIDSIRNGLKAILESAKTCDPNATLTSASVLDIAPEVLAATPEHGVILGCDPSLNIYFKGSNPRLSAVNPAELNFRFAGFHVHIGCGKQPDKITREMVRMMDAIAGVISVVIFREWEDARRREFYGLAGEYRLPAHGLEWRTLSSRVLTHPKITNLFLDLARFAARLGQQNMGYLWKADENEVQACINTLDVGIGEKILSENENMLRVMLEAIYKANTNRGGDKDPPKHAKKVLALIRDGAGAYFTTDVVKNWHLDGGIWEDHSDADRETITLWKPKRLP